MSAVIVRKNDDGTVDEVVAKGCSVHLEQMDESGFYIGIMASDDTYWQFPNIVLYGPSFYCRRVGES